jgi:hypothetical protein
MDGLMDAVTAEATATREVIELGDEFRSGWHYEMLWDAEENEITIIVTGKIEQNALDRTQTAMFKPPNELAFQVWERPFSFRQYMTSFVLND